MKQKIDWRPEAGKFSLTDNNFSSVSQKKKQTNMLTATLFYVDVATKWRLSELSVLVRCFF